MLRTGCGVLGGNGSFTTAARVEDSVRIAPTLTAGRGRFAGNGPALYEFVQKLLPTKLTSTDRTERNAGMLRVPLIASLVELGYRH